MTESQFVALRSERWRMFERTLARRPKRRFLGLLRETVSFPGAYRSICRDLNHARAQRYSIELIERLNRLVWSGHHLLYDTRAIAPVSAITLFTTEFPRTVRRFARGLLLCHLLFYGILALTYLYAAGSEARASLFLGEKGAQSMLEMYDPSSDHFLKPRGVTSDADMFGFYIQNNVSLGFETFAGGALAGVGSFVVLAYNALVLGAAIALIGAAGYGSTFFPFIVGHSAFELTAIIVFSLAGFMLGRSLLAPGRLTRAEALKKTGQEVLPLVVGAAIFLFIAACIEAFWSARIMDSAVKFAVASALWLSVLLFFFLGGRGERR